MAIIRTLYVSISVSNFELSRRLYEPIGFQPLRLGVSVGLGRVENAITFS